MYKEIEWNDRELSFSITNIYKDWGDIRLGFELVRGDCIKHIEYAMSFKLLFWLVGFCYIRPINKRRG